MIKQFLIGEYADDDDGWQRIVRSQERITPRKLQELAERFPELADIVPVWKTLAPILNDFVHGGVGQLTSNPINAVSEPRYPGAWFWSTALVYTVCMLATSGWFWVHTWATRDAPRRLWAPSAERTGSPSRPCATVRT